MFARKQFKWSARCQLATGRTVVEDVYAYWSPEAEGVRDAVADAARAQARKKHSADCHVLGVELIG